MGGPADVLTNRRMMSIRNDVQILQEKLPHAPMDTLVRFARGVRALGAYRHLLNNEGIGTFKLAEEAFFLQRPSLGQVEDWLPQLPSAKDPKLHLFRNPFDNQTLKDPRFRAFKAAFNWEGGYKIIQIADGCWSNCLMCATPIGNKDVKFMPFPMVLLLAMQLLDKNSKGELMLYDGGDIMQWHDTNFDADYGDLAAQLKRMGIPLSQPMTHGFWPGDEYAEEAARKYVALGMKLGLSVHLLHREVFPTPASAPNEFWLRKYAERFAHAINILKPRVRLLGTGGHPPISGNAHFTLEYIQDFYHTRVLPLIEPEMRDEYRNIDTRGRSPLKRQLFGDDECVKACASGVIPEGRAYRSPYFPLPNPDDSHGINTTIWMGDLGGSFVKKVGINGTVSVNVSPRLIEEPICPQPLPSQTVRELFPDPLSPEFKDFLRKLFFESCHPHGFFDDTIEFWTIFFPNHDFRKVSGMFARTGKPPRFSEENCRIFHQRLEHLPVISSELYYKFNISDLRGGDGSLKEGGPFSRYLYSLYTPTRTGKSKQPDERSSNILSRANGERQKEFLLSFEDGKNAIEKLEASTNLFEAIKNRNCTKAQLEEVYEILKDLPLLSPTFYLNVLELQTVTTLGFRANTGIISGQIVDMPAPSLSRGLPAPGVASGGL